MLTTLAIILVVLWALGLLGGFHAGGLLHILLVIALVAVVVQVLSGRRAL
ncbi:MAG: lmo0937 family membrane protein [Longimicrobiales bacterium]|nr:lmo0937 family membrane protein [Longimicrobiales bacterium]